MKKDVYSSLRISDSDLKWSASRIIINDFLKGKKHPASAIAMAFNILNGRAFDPDEDQNVRNISQDDMEKAMAAGIEKVATMDAVIADLKHKETVIRILAVENLIIACDFQSDISQAIPALAKALKDKDPAVRKNAALAFAVMAERGYDLSKSKKALQEASKDPEIG